MLKTNQHIVSITVNGFIETAKILRVFLHLEDVH